MVETHNEVHVVIYCRVSTREQGNSGLGLEAQESICRQVALVKGWQVVCVVTEVCSGGKALLARPELTKAVILANKHNAALMVKDISRLTRDMLAGQEFVNKRIYHKQTPQLILADTPDYDAFYLDLMLSFAAEERRKISKRTKEGLQALKARGETPGQAGGQAKRNKALAAIAPALAVARKLRKKGITWQAIADELNAKGYKTSTGGQWYASSIHHWLHDEELTPVKPEVKLTSVKPLLHI